MKAGQEHDGRVRRLFVCDSDQVTSTEASLRAIAADYGCRSVEVTTEPFHEGRVAVRLVASP